MLLIHGGAGTITLDAADPQAGLPWLRALADVVRGCRAMLADGAPALDVAVEAVRLLEECPLFNAGHGSVCTADGGHELDAAVMRGSDRAAGAVAGVVRVRNPVLAARALLLAGGPVMMAGPAADAFARAAGCEHVDPAWFGTAHRRAEWERVRHRGRGLRLDQMVLDHTATSQSGTPAADSGTSAAAAADDPPSTKFGTVGAVVRDAAGSLAAATSTGGLTNKAPGRIGDSPVIGAGCYADDRSVAVSCTGTGEAFIRAVAAHAVAARVEFAGMDVAAAAGAVIDGLLPPLGGHGGLIAVDAAGRVAMPFSTRGMYRAWVRADGSGGCAIDQRIHPLATIHERA